MKAGLVICIALGLNSMSAFASDVATTNKRPVRLSMAERRLRARQNNGGTIVSKPEGSVLEVINCQTAVPLSMLQEVSEQIMRHTRIPIVFTDKKSESAGASLEIVVNDTAPSLVSAIDDGWAKANFKMLVADNPSEQKLRQRVTKQLWRAIGASLGIGVSGFQPSIMRNIANVKELDNIPMSQPEPASLNCFDECPLFFGIEKIRITTYRKACEEGWAPAPTNDIQKAIWDQVHTTPSNPIKITYDKDKQKPVVK